MAERFELEHEYTWRRAIGHVIEEGATILALGEVGFVMLGLMSNTLLFWLGFGQLILASHVLLKGHERLREERRKRRVQALSYATQDVTTSDALVPLGRGERLLVQAKIAFGEDARNIVWSALLIVGYTYLSVRVGRDVAEARLYGMALTVLFFLPPLFRASWRTLRPQTRDRAEIEGTLLLERKRRTVEAVEGGLTLQLGDEEAVRGGLTQRDVGGLTQTEEP